MPVISKKTIVPVEPLCSKWRRKVMKPVATIEGITSIVLDPSKSTVTVIGEAEPVDIIKKVRNFRRSAMTISTGPSKDEKKDDTKKDYSYSSAATTFPQTPRTCQSCDVWYVVADGYKYNYCSVM